MNLLLIGFLTYLQIFIPPAIRKEVFVNYIYKIVGYVDLGVYNGILTLLESFWYFEISTGNYINWNGQIMVMEAMLEDRFNEIAGQKYAIKIEDAFRSDHVYFFNEGEDFEKIYMSNFGEDVQMPLLLSNNADYESDVDFIVRVYKANLTDDERSFFSVLMEKYRLVDKTYKILAKNE